MGITHVIRGEEHLPNTPKAQLLWEALDGGPLPTWAHVPVLVNEKRQKLSKRRDKVALEEYRDEGYLAEAMRNYLMLLGWAPTGDDEIVPWSRHRGRVPPGGRGALAGVLRREEADGVQRRVHPHAHRRRVRGRGRAVARAASRRPLADAFVALAPLVQERVKVLAEVPAYVEFFDTVPDVPDDFAKATKEPWAAAGARRGDRRPTPAPTGRPTSSRPPSPASPRPTG